MKQTATFFLVVLFCFFSPFCKGQKVPDEEYQALVDLYNSANGKNWSNKWDINENNLHESSWYGVSVEGGHITGLSLTYNNLSGKVPVSIGNLKYLKTLTLYGYSSQNLGDTDLNIFSELESLESLDLRSCKLKGSIPASWKKLKNLKTLNLSSNNLSGDLPSELGEMTSLQTVDLSSNQLISVPKNIERLTKLVTLNLSNNQLTGSVIKEFENISTLKTLNLSGNKLSDVQALLPSTVSLNLTYQTLSLDKLVYKGTDIKLESLPKIVYYNRSKNDFSDKNTFSLYIGGSQAATNLKVSDDGSLTLPASAFFSMKKTDAAYLYQNGGSSYYSQLVFSSVEIDQPRIPDEEYQALVDLYNSANGPNWSNKWDVSTNNLHEGAWYGISIENGHITGLNLTYNNVSGKIQASIGNLKYLKTLSLYGYSSQNLGDTDLNIFSELESLESLDLRSCKLKGSIPASWKKLKNLKTLSLNGNNLSGDLPSELGEMTSLQTVDLSSNQFISVPKNIEKLTKLVTLNLSNNQLTGSVIKEFEKITTLKTLNLSSNKLSDVQALLPSTVSLNLTYQTLSLDKLVYKGVDVKLESLPKIVYYNRSKNDFSDKNTFSLYIGSSQAATNLKVSDDGSLTIPASAFFSMKKTDAAYLYQNTGSSAYSRLDFSSVEIDQPRIPDEEYQALVDLYNSANGKNWSNKWNVSENNLHEGSWYGVSIENGHITGLSLTYNNVSGKIQASIGNLKYLKTLSLYGYSSQDLSSTDLDVFSELESLESLDLRSCKLKGSIPASWKKLKNLKTLSLNGNNLSGDLPSELGEMTSLQTVDLSSNQFISVPKNIEKLTQLVTLNLSNNQLTGSVIKEFEKVTTLKTLNLSGNKLSDVQALLPSTVSLNLTYQTLSLDKLVYKGVDVKLESLPKIVYYNRSKNDFSEKNTFSLYIGSQVVNNLKVSDDGSLTIPASAFSTMKKTDVVYLYQSTGSSSAYSRLDFSSVEIDLPRIPDEEYQALVDLYNSANGKNWSNKWDVSANNLHEGSWYGISIENGHITGLSLTYNNVSGKIQASIGNLKYLKALSLYGYSSQDLSSTDLDVFSELESLESLDLRSCNLKGSIPASWKKLKNLKTLNLNNNNIENADEALLELPLTTANFSSQTINIPSIEVGATELTIDLPTFCTYAINSQVGSFNNKNYFYLYINGVNVTENYSNIEGKLVFKNVDLLGIKLTDKIKIVQNGGLANSTTISYATVTFGRPLEENEFEILKKLYSSTNGDQWTKKWDITQNNLNEKSWYGVGTREGHVISLTLSGNNLSGSLPEELSGLKYLETLDLQNNAIGGSLPANMGALTSLKTLYLQYNKLGGNIPDLSGIKTLVKLSLSDNQFKGTIPAHLNQLEKVEHLNLSNNSFESLSTVFTYNLDKVYLNVRGQKIVKEDYLNIEGDQIAVELPSINAYDDLNQNYQGKYLFALQVNNLTISEAVGEGNLVVFPDIDISEIPEEAKITVWQRTGAAKDAQVQYAGVKDKSRVPVPEEEYAALVKLYQQTGGAGWTQTWDVSTNNLHLKKWKGVTNNDGHIVAIDLSGNNLTGSIPPELADLKELRTLNLSLNKLTGSIPKELSGVSRLTTLDLSENSLTGIETPFSSDVNLKIDRQNSDLGTLSLLTGTIFKDTDINRYDHSKGEFINQTYSLSIGSYYRTITLPKDGMKLVDLMSEWNVPNNQTMVLRQIAGTARNSTLTYTLKYKMGDANLDDAINVLDIQSILNYILKQSQRYFNYGASDLNKDKDLNLLDVILLVNKIQDNSIENSGENSKVSRYAKEIGEKAIISVEDGVLHIESPDRKTAAFDIRLKGVSQSQVEKLISNHGYTVYVSEKDGITSIVGFTLGECLSGKIAVAKVGSDTEILNALLSDETASEIPYEIRNKTMGTDTEIVSVPDGKVLNYPNPFTKETTIVYSLPENAEKVTLKVFNMQGQLVRKEDNLETQKGDHKKLFLQNNLEPGVYYYLLEVYTSHGNKVYKNKMLIK